MTETAFDRVREALHGQVEKLRDTGHGRLQAECPAHDDGNPSLSVARTEGKALVHCHAGCDPADVLDALGLSLRDLYDDPHGTDYRYPDGRIVHRTWDEKAQRFKKFRQSGTTTGRALYRADQLPAAVEAGHPVYVVEGEQDVHALESLGAVATCNAMGAGKADRFDWSPLSGADVVLVADADDAGAKHARQVAELLDGTARSVVTVHAATGKDAADHVAAGHGVDEFHPVDEPDRPPRRVRSQPVNEITMKRRQYLWEQRLPLGEVTLWVGHAGIGKSQAAVWLAAQVSRGALPGELHGQPCPVLYLGTEDSWEFTLAPRFAAADADLGNVYRLYVETEHGEATVSLAVDMDMLREEIEATGARLVVLDALLSTFGSAKLTDQNVVRQHLEPLARLAQELNIAVVGVAHFRKASDPNPLHMISGNAEFGQVVRSAIGFAPDREAGDGSCVLSLVKTNIAPQDLPSIRYRIESATVDTDDGPTDVGRFVVLGETDQNVRELLNQEAGSPEEQSERVEAVEWLRAYLTEENRGGEAVAGDVLKAAERDGFAKRTIQRARTKAGVTTRKGDNGWLWVYSPSDEQDATTPGQGATPQQGATNGKSVTSEDAKAPHGAPRVSPWRLGTLAPSETVEPPAPNGSCQSPNCQKPGWPVGAGAVHHPGCQAPAERGAA